MSHHEQFPVAVRNFSSEYGPPYSTNQVLKNVCGQPSDASYYGDNQYAAAFRRFGDLHLHHPSYLAFPCLMTPPWFPYTDFMECSFSQPVLAVAIHIYENFFPGSVKRILATRHSCKENKSFVKHWQVLWQYDENAENGKCFPFTYHIHVITFPKTVSPVDTIRIEFDFTKSEYYSQVEAVKLIGEKLVETMSCEPVVNRSHDFENGVQQFPSGTISEFCIQYPQGDVITKVSLPEMSVSSSVQSQGIDLLPSEILIKILGFLDIDDLSRASRINKLFYYLSKDPALYTCINLRPFYRFLVDQSLIYISKRCGALQKLDLSWLGSNNQISTPALCAFLRSVPNIIELRLSSCQMLASSVLETLAIYCSNLKLLDISYCTNGLHLCVSWLTNLKRLQYLNLTHTLITTSELLCLLDKLKNLEWLLLGSPSLIADQDAVISSITNTSCGALKGIQLWYWDKISFSCISQFLHCHGRNITELDLGWCLGIGVHDILPNIAGACPNLVVLILTAHHETTDAGLIDLSKGCVLLEQLDILGSRNITYSALLTLVTACQNLIFLDVSYCSKLSVEDIANLQVFSSNISIKHVETYLHKSKAFCSDESERSFIRL